MSTDGRRFLIAAGTEHYSELEEDLSSVPSDVARIANFFRAQNYQEELLSIRHDPTSSDFKRELGEWLANPSRLRSDTAVVYYSGHGENDGEIHYLLTADSMPGKYAWTAVQSDFPLRVLGAEPKVRRLLLILDTCYSGQGALNAAELAGRMSNWQPHWDTREGVWIVAATRPKELAGEGGFAAAFVQAAEDVRQRVGGLQRYIALESIVDRLNEILRGQGAFHEATYSPAALATGLPPFVPNPNYEPDAPVGVDLETRDRLRALREEMTAHWGPKARGLEIAAQAGWYFTGRTAALRELVRWLADPSRDPR